MGRNFPIGTQLANLRKWEASAEFKQQTKVIRKRGRPTGSKMPLKVNEEPRTPFEALRILMKLTQIEWAKVIEIAPSNLSQIERGNHVANIAVAKRMQEEARKKGIAVTLDELYQHVISYGEEVDEESKSNENRVQQS